MASKRDLTRPSHLYPVRNIIKEIKDKKISYGIYVIVDRAFIKGDRIFKWVARALSGGASMIQFRDKTSSTNEIIETAKALKRMTKRYSVPFIINDRLDVALAVGADGLHIGQGDVDISLAKRLMGRKRLIGVTIKNLVQAYTAKRKGADYLGVGPVFTTPIKVNVKPKGLKLLGEIKKLNVPFFAIGGIDCANISKLVEKGFKNVAVIRAICEAKDPYAATHRMKVLLQEALI